MKDFTQNIEEISAEIHKCYCRTYERRFGKPYWTNGDYSKLDEPTKDYDREMAVFHIERLSQAYQEGFRYGTEESNAHCSKAIKLSREGIYNEGYRDGREEAIEECAIVAEELCFCRDVNHKRINEPTNCPVAKSTAKAIRQLKGSSDGR